MSNAAQGGPMTEQILDHGYLKFIEAWGSDELIIESARMSTDGAFRGWGPLHSKECEYAGTPKRENEGCCPAAPGDEKLLRYLYKNKHTTPFEMGGLTIEVQAPIFVFRQWHRHRTQSYNELSARYTELPDLFYVPSVERIIASAQSNTNKQASGKGAEITEAEAIRRQLRWHEKYEADRKFYLEDIAAGMAPELARISIPVAQYSRMRASGNLWNWLRFQTLRLDAHAQYEIRIYAEALDKVIEERFPRTWQLFREGQFRDQLMQAASWDQGYDAANRCRDDQAFAVNPYIAGLPEDLRP